MSAIDEMNLIDMDYGSLQAVLNEAREFLRKFDIFDAQCIETAQAILTKAMARPYESRYAIEVLKHIKQALWLVEYKDAYTPDYRD